MPRNRRQHTNDLPDVLTKVEAANYLRCSAATVQRLTREGLLTPYRLGQRPRYPLAMLKRFVAEGSGDHAATP